jgi:hypothetical protein
MLPPLVPRPRLLVLPATSRARLSIATLPFGWRTLTLPLPAMTPTSSTLPRRALQWMLSMPSLILLSRTTWPLSRETFGGSTVMCENILSHFDEIVHLVLRAQADNTCSPSLASTATSPPSLTCSRPSRSHGACTRRTCLTVASRGAPGITKATRQLIVSCIANPGRLGAY